MRLLRSALPLALILAGCASNDAPPVAPVAPAPAAPAPAAPSAPTAAAGDLAGSYAATGTNPNGSPYTTTLTVTPRGNVYQFTWANGDDGIGVQQGDFVAVGYGGRGCGAAAYRLAADGSMAGAWGMYGQNASGTERATRTGAAGAGPAGAYTIEGTNFDGSPYRGTLTVDAAAGGAHRLTWQAGQTTQGYGLVNGQDLGSSYGGQGCGVVTYRVQGDGALVGQWSVPASPGMGTERAVRT